MGSIYKYVFISSIDIAILLSWLGDLKLPFLKVHTFDGTMFPVEHNFEVDVKGRFLVAGKTGPYSSLLYSLGTDSE